MRLLNASTTTTYLLCYEEGWSLGKSTSLGHQLLARKVDTTYKTLEEVGLLRLGKTTTTSTTLLCYEKGWFVEICGEPTPWLARKVALNIQVRCAALLGKEFYNVLVPKRYAYNAKQPNHHRHPR